MNRIGEYVTRWLRWLRTGVEGLDDVATIVAEVQKTTAICSPCGRTGEQMVAAVR